MQKKLSYQSSKLQISVCSLNTNKNKHWFFLLKKVNVKIDLNWFGALKKVFKLNARPYLFKCYLFTYNYICCIFSHTTKLLNTNNAKSN